VEKETVRVVPYSDAWPAKFAGERERLSRTLGGRALAIEHIGSTAVPRIDAKPIIDIAAKVAAVGIVPDLIAPLAELGYTYEGEYGLPGRHFFIKGRPREFHLHIVDDTTDYWPQWLAFRDLLRRDERARQEYAALKRQLAAQFHDEREKYTAAKSAFIKAAIAGKTK
jgi:GrpB-like predicted nucleotidyltransferase (UPF0157 family)